MDTAEQEKTGPAVVAARRRPQFPYPGLRAFEDNEARIFFGRDRHIDEILERLATSHFVPVIGPSGCGKSSLIRAGVNPALRAGRYYDAGSRWRIATMRPENSPIWNLASILCGLTRQEDEPEDYEAISRVSTMLLADPDGIEEFRQESSLGDDENVLLVVDQFEELFNIESDAERDATEVFISIILNIFEEKFDRIHCIITMRTDNLGDCARYPGLADAINQTLYLTPNLTEEEMREAVELPAIRFGGTFEDGLIDRILEDMTHEVDQLPLMQHVMQRIWTTFDGAGDAPRVFTHALYEAFGCIADTVNLHAAELLETLRPEQSVFVPILFRQLTERRLGGAFQDVRRPTLFKDIALVADLSADAGQEALRSVVDHFRAPNALFLRPQMTERAVIDDDTSIDIVHECLIRKWDKLKEWVEQESKSVQDLRDLDSQSKRFRARRSDAAATPDDAVAESTDESQSHWLRRMFSGGRRYLDKEAADELLRWRRREKPNAAWAGRYGIAQSRFDQAMAFLDSSHKRHQRRKFATSGVVAVTVVGLFYYILSSVQERAALERSQVSLISSDLTHSARLLSPDMTKGNLELWSSQWTGSDVKAFEKDYPRLKLWLDAQKSIQEGNLNLMLVPDKGSSTGPIFRPEIASGEILGLDAHPDGKIWAVLSRRRVRLVSETGAPIRDREWTFAEGTGQVDSPRANRLTGGNHVVAFHPEGKFIHVISDSRIVRRIPAGGGKMTTVRLLEGAIVRSALSPDCAMMAVVRRLSGDDSGAYEVEILDLLQNRRTGVFRIGAGRGKLTAISYDAASSGLLALVFNDTHVTQWRVPEGDGGMASPAVAFTSPVEGIHKIQMSRDGAWLAAVTDSIGHLWHMSAIKTEGNADEPPVIGPTRSLFGYSLPIKLLRFLGGGELLTVRQNGETLVWRYDDGLSFRRLVNEPSEPLYQTVSRSGRLSFIDKSGSFLHRNLWPPRDDRFEIRKLAGLATKMSITEDGRIIAIGYEDGSIELVTPYLLKDKQRIGFRSLLPTSQSQGGIKPAAAAGEYRRDPRAIGQLALSGNGATVVGLRDDGTLITSTKGDGDAGAYITAQTAPRALTGEKAIARLALSPDGRQLAILSDIGEASEAQAADMAALRASQLSFYSRVGGAWVPSPNPPKVSTDSAICSIAYGSGGDHFAAGTIGGNLYVAKIKSGRVSNFGKPLQSFPGNSVAAILFARPQSQLLITTVLAGFNAPSKSCRHAGSHQNAGDSRSVEQHEVDRDVKIAVARLDGSPIPAGVNPGSLPSPTLLFRGMSFLPGSETLLVTDVDLLGEKIKVRFFDLFPADVAKVEIQDTFRGEIDPSRFVDPKILRPDRRTATGKPDLFAAKIGCQDDQQTCWMIVPTILRNRMLVFAYRNLKRALPPAD